MRTILALTAILSFADAARGAEIDPHTQVSSFTLAHIITATRAMNFQAEMIGEGEARLVGITAPSGVKFLAQPEACQRPKQSDCYGLSIFAIFANWQPTLQQINYFNKHRNFTKAFVEEDTAILMRYEIADYGIPIGNIASSLANFAAIAGQFRQFLQAGGSGASYQPTPDRHVRGSGFGAPPQAIDIAEPSFDLSPRNDAYINRPDGR